jgi:hypothetical protein
MCRKKKIDFTQCFMYRQQMHDARCTMHRLTPQPHHVFVVRFFPVAVFVVCVVVCVVCVVCVVRASKYQKK